MTRADLHVHTYYSDGLMSPAEAVAEAKRAGVNVLAVTDHDSALACREVKRLCREAGMTGVNGIEVSAYTGDVKIHTLGYAFDEESAVFKQFCAELFKNSVKRTEDIIFKLNKAGVKLTLDEVLKKRFSENSPVHIMHVASAGAEKLNFKDRFAFFREFLAYGKPAYSGICRPSPETAVEVINACGGFASLAHPARIEMDKPEVIDLVKRLKSAGLGGIEAVYSAHTNSDTAYYKEMAKTFGLVVTGGSDTHYKGGSKRIGAPEFFAGKLLADKLKV